MDQFSIKLEQNLRHYKMHFLVFFLAFFIALTFAHPSILVTDEWVTLNQLAQVHEGHQLFFNEGKYGSYENGTVSNYFKAKHNILAYTLFLPLISLPAYSIVDLFGENFVFLILYLWTFCLIAIFLLLNAFFREYTIVGKWNWTPVFLVTIFVLFFVNLFYYIPFSIVGKDAYPEIMAIVFTYCFLFALMAVMVYEICRTIFEDSVYSFFGTVICFSCSSYLFWTNFCKDHALVAFLFTAVVLMVVKFFYTHNVQYLFGAFFFSGLLAWARPELALFTFASLCVILVYICVLIRNGSLQIMENLFLFVSPLFTLIGAIPFFINNYMFTKNIFIPPFTLWTDTTDSVVLQQNTSNLLGSFFDLLLTGTNINPSTLFHDLYGIFLNPQSGSIGVLPLTPLFLIALFILAVFFLTKNIQLSSKEKQFFIVMVLLSAGVFFAYFRSIHVMNTDPGIVPDIRYLSPIYLPLNIMGLLVLRKIPAISDKPLDLLKWMVCFWIIIIPVSLIAISQYYPSPEGWSDVFPTLGAWIYITVIILAAICLMGIISIIVFKKPGTLTKILLALLCALPFIWQVDATFIARVFGVGLGGYSFWIPVVRMIFTWIS